MIGSIKHNCQEELRKVSLKATPARLGVLQVLENTDTPLDVSDVLTDLQQQGISVDKVTVFRIMKTLTEKGLVAPIQLNEGKLRYEHAEKANHHHFICQQCGIIEDIADCNISTLEKNIKEKKGLLIRRHSLEFFGLCQNCQK